MALADDPEGALRVWRIAEATGTLEELPLPPAAPASPSAAPPSPPYAPPLAFESSEMYVVGYTCKRGSLRVLYTWEGQQASLKARAATGLLVQVT